MDIHNCENFKPHIGRPFLYFINHLKPCGYVPLDLIFTNSKQRPVNISSSVCTTNTRYSWFQTFAMFWMFYSLFWVIPRRLNFICRRFGTLYLFHLHGQVGVCRMTRLGTCLGYYTGKGLVRKWPDPLGRRVTPASEFYMPTFRNTVSVTFA